MTTNEVMAALEALGSSAIRNIQLKHGAVPPLFGVKIGDMKPMVKKIKKDYELSKSLYNTGNGDAMYFAGLIADEGKMSKADLQDWVEKAPSSMISEYTVPWIAAESKFGWELGVAWIESEVELIACSGWNTLSSVVSLVADADLDVVRLEDLLNRVEANVHTAPNKVKYCMNGFVIACGSFVSSLHAKAAEVAANIGKVSVMMGDTACKVPLASEYIQKVKDMGKVGNKKKVARC